MIISILSCSNKTDDYDNKNNMSQQAVMQQNKQKNNLQIGQQNTTIKALFLKDNNNRTAGDFTSVQYQIENYTGNVLLSEHMECNADDKSISCHAETNLNSLKPAIYRIVIKSNDGLLGSDLFEIIPNLVPVIITVDNESTGFYLISLIGQQSGFSEDEIYKRVRHILSISEEQDYDLEITLYDLFMYHGGSQNISQALRKIIRELQNDQPVSIEGQDGVSGSTQPIH